MGYYSWLGVLGKGFSRCKHLQNHSPRPPGHKKNDHSVKPAKDFPPKNLATEATENTEIKDIVTTNSFDYFDFAQYKKLRTGIMDWRGLNLITDYTGNTDFNSKSSIENNQLVWRLVDVSGIKRLKFC